MIPDEEDLPGLRG